MFYIAVLTFLPLALSQLASSQALGKTVRYELTATKGSVNLSGKKSVDWALMLNGSIPAPTLEFTEGDDAEIVVKNQLEEEVSIHWHGILLPPEEDGVAYVNTPPILAGKSHTFRFKIRQHGTYWYHSHTKLQEQKGIYGALIIHPRERKIAYDRDVVLVLSDWSDEDADQIIKNLRKDGDYYLYKKNSMRSIFGAAAASGLWTYFANEWDRMGGMDLSDVGYDAFLINGKRDQELSGKPGEKLRLRIINAAASSYFYIALGQEPMQVVAADGMDIKPAMAKEILVGMAETYDVLFTVPKGKKTEFRATVQDVTGRASAWIGEGEKISAPDKPQPDLYAPMDHSAHQGMDHSAHQGMDHSTHADHSAAIESLTVDKLESPSPTEFAADLPRYDIKLVLGGDMERYVWHINGKAIHEERTLTINEGDVVRFTFVNNTMMHHPMHLHGHFFRVLNASAEKSPLKHTVDVPPHGTRTIEFLANEPGEWMLHCHNLYHMKTGMARVVKYSTFTPKPEVAKHQSHDPHLHDHLYLNGLVTVASNRAELGIRLSRTWETIEVNVSTEEYEEAKNTAEGDLFVRRWFSNFFNVIVGATRFPDYDEEPNRVLVGVGYTLPLLLETNLLIDHTGKLRLDLEKRFQWTKSFFSEIEASFRQSAKTEVHGTLMYGPVWEWAVGGVATDETVGVGAQYKF
jgi:FtsP/CotA-like multicopper oxidase with cupredoxin domain